VAVVRIAVRIAIEFHPLAGDEPRLSSEGILTRELSTPMDTLGALDRLEKRSADRPAANALTIPRVPNWRARGRAASEVEFEGEMA
jgi:hypothetical protein